MCAIMVIQTLLINGGEDMERKYELFLEAMRTALSGGKISWGGDVSAEELMAVLALAQEHHVLPMIFETVYACPAAMALPPEVFAGCKGDTMRCVLGQSMKTNEFLALQRHLQQNGVRVLTVKGIVCRQLYPQPDYRSSGDEDVLCGIEGFDACHEAMVSFGMEPGNGMESYEVPYRKSGGTLYIELHKTLFAQDNDVFSGCNDLFRDVFDRSVDITVQGTKVPTLCPTDHMLYLIVHAFKHFLHSGFGIRQVCDMTLYANAYDSQIDWERVLIKCRDLRAEKFAAALLKIGRKHLVVPADDAHWHRFWGQLQVDERPLLADLLYGGIYGSSDRSRVHSSNMTLNAVAADKKGKRTKGNVIRTVFPSAKSISGRFPYLRTKPFLLPVAWTSRIFGYMKESLHDPNSAASEVINTGRTRIELLRSYDIID